MTRMYEVFTGEVVRIFANNEAEMWDKLKEGDYSFVEADSTIRFVGADDSSDFE